MAVTHVQSVNGSDSATTSDALTIPAVSVGDVLLLFCTNDGATTAPTVTDDDTGGNTWGRVDPSGNSGHSVWWKHATANTSGKTVTADGFTTACAVVLSAYTGAKVSGTPYENVNTEAQSAGEETIVGFTPSRDGCMIILAVTNRNGAFGCANQSCTNPGVLTERAEVLNPTICAVMTASNAQVEAAATGDITWTQTNSAHLTTVFNLITADAGGSTKWLWAA